MAAFLFLLIAQAYGDEVRRVIDVEHCLKPGDRGEIVVCGRRQQNERYRLPDRDHPFDPSGETESVMRERTRWAEGGEAGIQSCGQVGPGGWTGCTVRKQAREREQYQWGKNVPTKKW